MVLESFGFMRDGAVARGAAYVVGLAVVSIAAAWLGTVAGRRIGR
jgi:hypothetical protein